MKEIGGFIELDHYAGKMLHEEAIALNCGRNALAYLIQARKINKMALPYFMCDSVFNLCKQQNVEIRYYHIDEHFLPEEIDLMEDEWLYLADIYGQLVKEDIRRICNKYQRVIVDYAQAYFEIPLDGVDSLYTCRKFFGVPDGAFLYTDARLEKPLQQDESFERMRFLLGRFERTASEFYSEYVENNKLFDTAPIMRMSKLTENLLHAVDYEQVKNIRTANFDYLKKHLCEINLLNLNSADGAFAYPLFLENGAQVRKKLIAQKIYVPTLWPNVLEELPETYYEHQLAKNILPLPCDQRYDEADMEYICSNILKIAASIN
ncbi:MULTISPECIES: hypothetical protein [unclassified Ruminococcus]|uniref:hypothetical protein n=1 Tax=unclassified Ruminococcus TaxID=2608920 RepID=UPI0021092019|nr:MULTISPECIES: hypothetical protein [unclassified Ruminococcus]MCQ4022557.1 hypothetical protein [Ruminococcus sp. zg-924]MCQ4114797.1 hypothetical protein [Ruminococcus sp. zg-921]